MTGVARALLLNNGFSMPMLGLGTYRGKGNEIYEAVRHAIKLGYRHIDTAMGYCNEVDIGRAINDTIQDGEVSREDLFVVTKLPGSCNRPNLVVPALRESLKNLALDYVDLFLIHTPISRVPLKDDEVANEGRLDAASKDILDDVEPTATWRSMEECVHLNLTRSIGVSNFNSKQLQVVLDSCRIKPVTNQVECHPYLTQKKLRLFCSERDVIITSYRPLGGQIRMSGHPNILENESVKKIAEKHSKSAAQILLRWHIQHNLSLLVKSTNFKNIKENFEIFDFNLSNNELSELDKLNCGHRYVPFLESVESKQYPFHIEY